MISKSNSVLLGVVSYCADIIPIWEGMRKSFRKANVDLDFITFTSYERQVEALIDKTIHIAWNGPIAHVRLQKRSSITSLGMRDVDRGFKSYIICQKDHLQNYSTIKSLEGKRIVAGSYDSPQAYIMPLHFLKKQELNFKTIELYRYDRDIGKHGDTAVGEIEVLKSLQNKEADIGFVSKLMWDRAVQNGFDPHGSELAVLPFNIPVFNHCQFDALTSLPTHLRELFHKGLYSMSWEDDFDRSVMQQEGIRRRWESAEETGYDLVREALAGEPAVPFPGPAHTVDRHPFKVLYEM